MKSLTQYVCESANKTSKGVNGKVKTICDNLMNGVNYSKFKYIGTSPNEQFSKYNEKLLIANFSHNEYRALTPKEYYELAGFGNFMHLANYEMAEFDEKYGDIIIVDKNDKPVFFIDLEISTIGPTVGSIPVSSLANFTDEGYYLCVSQHGKKYFIVSHKDIVEMAENDPTIISPKSTRNYRKGYSVNFAGETKNSEDYISGSTLEEIL